MTISDIGSQVQDRLEEPRGSGIFWDLQNEIYPIVAEMMNAATLMTGEPQMRSLSNYNLTPNSNVQPMPAGALAILRVDGPGTVLKTSVYDLDRFSHGWEGVLGPQIEYWFPIGLTQFGVYPQVPTAQRLVISYIMLPVTMVSTYDGTENVPFQAEYSFGFVEGAAAMARLKEGGAEFTQGISEYDKLIDKLAQLGKFGWRKGACRFTRALGIQAEITDVTKRG